ncbi:hypothetical protein EMPS_11312 [Entomortierella parvispora]|uniref:Uncharacterized protein n=1 Tax=Entomortierella parvispora TaxID=205924 RepID=A0A9P3M243_9FUNG|nr:hypothetical protein EMPS_11312 [Entomortierella parvispora]
MDFLAGYASDSDSESELAGPTRGGSDPKDQDEENILAAMKDLQSFAAMVDPTSASSSTSEPKSNPTSRTSQAQGNGVPGIENPEDQQFLSFLKEIEAIPIPETDTEPLPPPPPPSSSLQTENGLVPPPPPPPPPISDDSQSTIASLLDSGKAVHAIYNRLQNLSLLPSPTIDTKDLERRLLEFEVRIEDWEKDGLESWYFLGADRSQAIHSAQGRQANGVDQLEMTAIPPFGGIVGAMEKRVQDLELKAAPFGWRAIWDPEEEAYGFEHVRTGTYSPVYPSLEQLLYLDPPAPPPPSTSSNYKRTKTPYTSSAWSASASSSTPPSNFVSSISASPTTSAAPASTHNPWTSPSTSSTGNPVNAMATDTPPNIKKKKRKLAEESTPPTNDFADQHIHPSRRAALGPSQAASSSSTSTSKPMPKKLASLLQKWNEKDKDPSDDEEDEDEEEDRQEHEGAGASGANTESLGGDWRERRLHR